MIRNPEELNDCISNLKRKTYRGYSIVSFDCEFVNHEGKPYRDYPKLAKHFDREHEFPTHDDYPFSLVRWISLGSPYGDTFIIDASKMTKPMVDTLVDYLKQRSTIVVGFNFPSDAWALHLTFGQRKFPFNFYEEFTKVEKKTYRKHGILKDIRVIDLSNVVEAVRTKIPGYRAEDWEKLGIVPEGRGLWHLAQAVLCIDLVGNDTSEVPNIRSFWNLRYLSNSQMKYIELDSQMCVLTFLGLLRYRLIPDAHEIIGGFDHDYRSPDSFKEDLKKFSTDADKRHE